MNDVLRFYPVISGFPTLLVIFEFFYFIRRDRRLLRWGSIALEIMILVVPFILLRTFENVMGMKMGEALFNPAYGWFMYLLIVLCQLAYFYCSLRKKIAPPLWEVAVNVLLLLGIALNIMIAIQLAALPGIFTICLPASLLFILMLVNNRRLLIFTLEDVDVSLSKPVLRGRLFSQFIKRKFIGSRKLH